MQDLSNDEIDRFLDEQTVGRLGCRDEDAVYVVPLIYARRGQSLYLLTMDGRKTCAARENPSVCFEVDEYDRATGSWKSVIVWGRYEELQGEDKAEALAVLGARHGTRRSSSSAANAPARPIVAFRIVIERASGRSVARPDAPPGDRIAQA